MSDKEDQDDEILALASIYDEDTFSSTSDGDVQGGQFSAQLELPAPFHVKFSAEDKEYELCYLPPVMLYFNLPEDYPSRTPPDFTLSCKWLTLPQLSRLCAKLDEIWEENKGEVVLFMWTSFLKDEVIDYLHIISPLNLSHVVSSKSTKQKLTARKCSDTVVGNKGSDNNISNDSKICDTKPEQCNATNDVGNQASERSDTRAVQDIAAQELLLPTLLEYDTSHREFVFKSTLYTCEVCFLEKLGALCIQYVGCNHVYCKECMTEYFTIQITEGNVKALTCPKDKCDSQAHPSQVNELVAAELFSRYDRLLLQTSLDTMSDIVYCPRKGCNCAVMVDSDNMGSCSACSYVFCVFCKMVYHGVSACKLRPEQLKNLRTEYEAANQAQKKYLEQKYGKQVIKKAIEEMYTYEWLEEFSKKCPNCGTHIQKMDGCNKISCTKCRSQFCWICNCRLPKANPYRHFSDPDTTCYNKLFHGAPAEEQEVDQEEWYEEELENDEEEWEVEEFQDEGLIIKDIVINNNIVINNDQDFIQEDLIARLLIQEDKDKK